jgi:hypothetical protein
VKRLIYRYTFLFELLAILPVVALCIFLQYQGLVDSYAYVLAFAWGGFVVAWVNRRIPNDLHQEALRKLDEDCDPVAFLKDIAFLLSRRTLSARRRFVLAMEHAGGLDSLGRYAEALAEMERLEREDVLLDPATAILFQINYTTIALHVERTQADTSARIREIENNIVSFDFPPQIAEIFQGHLEMLRDSARFVSGEYMGLREKFVASVERAREGGSRRLLVAACMRLARLYDKLERREEAIAMYGYVVQNGNLLGIVREAAERREALTAEKNTAPSDYDPDEIGAAFA